MTVALLILLYIISAGYLVFWASLWIVHIMAIIYGKWRLYKSKRSEPPDPELGVGAGDKPGVSIIKPLVGSDTHLFQNLETFFQIRLS